MGNNKVPREMKRPCRHCEGNHWDNLCTFVTKTMLANAIAKDDTRFETIQLDDENMETLLALHIAKKGEDQSR